MSEEERAFQIDRVSVVIPCWNRDDLIVETLESLRAQSHEDWEAIVVDDLSTDRSADLVLEVAAEDSRVQLVQNPWKRRGASPSRNLGASLASGEFVLFLDSDDLLAPFALEHRVRALRDDPRAGIVASLTQSFQGEPMEMGNLWNVSTSEDDLDRFCRGDNPWITIGAMYRRNERFESIRWPDEAVTMDDWEYSIRMLSRGTLVTKLASVDSYYRVAHGDSIMQLNITNHPLQRDICERRRGELFRVVDVLERDGNLSSLRKEGLAYCHFRQAEQFAIAGLANEAQRTLLQAAFLGLGSRWMWAEMRAVFRLLDVKFARWAAWRYLPRRFHFTQRLRSKTLLQLPAPEVGRR
jgi:glycosyltransferase involved in cell wall biosynthesis